jgi:hypothetical protein
VVCEVFVGVALHFRSCRQLRNLDDREIIALSATD